jgi:hypothetical protein
MDPPHPMRAPRYKLLFHDIVSITEGLRTGQKSTHLRGAPRQLEARGGWGVMVCALHDGMSVAAPKTDRGTNYSVQSTHLLATRNL